MSELIPTKISNLDDEDLQAGFKAFATNADGKSVAMNLDSVIQAKDDANTAADAANDAANYMQSSIDLATNAATAADTAAAAANTAADAANQATADTNAAIATANTSAANADIATAATNDAIANAETATTVANTATDAANTATAAANAVVEDLGDYAAQINGNTQAIDDLAIDDVDGLSDALELAAGASTTIQADGLPLAMATTETQLDFKVLYASTNDDILTSDDSAETVTFAKNGRYQLLSSINITNSSSQDTEATFYVRNATTNAILHQRTATIERQTSNATVPAVIISIDVTDAPLVVKFSNIASVTGLTVNSTEILLGTATGGGAAIRHNLTTNRDADDAHPISAITGLRSELDTFATTTSVDAKLALKADATYVNTTAKELLFRDLWSKDSSGQYSYDSVNGVYKLTTNYKDIDDAIKQYTWTLTYDEALETFALRQNTKVSVIPYVFSGTYARVLPPLSKYNISGINVDLTKIVFQNRQVEVLNLFNINSTPSLYDIKVKSMDIAFNGCISLKTILGVYDMSELEVVRLDFISCLALETIYIKNLGKSLIFSSSPNLSKESILYLIENCQTDKTFSVTLDTVAYARLSVDSDVIAALNTYTNVTLISE